MFAARRPKTQTTQGKRGTALIEIKTKRAIEMSHCEIPLTKGYYAIVDASDYEKVNAFKWYAAERRTGTGRLTVYAGRGHGCILMHRFILGDSAAEIDHKNGDGLDNRRSNIRPASRTQNNANMKKRLGAASRFKGVSFHPGTGKWRAGIWSSGTRKHLGLFVREWDAAVAYNHAALETFGEFAKINKLKMEV